LKPGGRDRMRSQLVTIKSNETITAWEKRLDHALKNLEDLTILNRSSLARLSYIEKLAQKKYKGRILPRGLAVREVLRACIDEIICELNNEPVLHRACQYLAMIEKGMNCGHISKELGLSREHVSRFYRRRALGLITEKFLYTMKNGFDGKLGNY
jgi:signal recognition particle subunit SEC65